MAAAVPDSPQPASLRQPATARGRILGTAAMGSAALRRTQGPADAFPDLTTPGLPTNELTVLLLHGEAKDRQCPREQDTEPKALHWVSGPNGPSSWPSHGAQRPRHWTHHSLPSAQVSYFRLAPSLTQVPEPEASGHLQTHVCTPPYTTSLSLPPPHSPPH